MLVKVFEAGALYSDDYIIVITGPNFARLEWMVRLMVLTCMHLTGLNAESKTYVLDTG